jgi:hypothetical protein
MKKHSGCLGHFCTAQISHIISVVGMSTYSTQIDIYSFQEHRECAVHENRHRCGVCW